MDGSDHGRHDETKDNGSIDSQVEEMLLKIVIFMKKVTNIGTVVIGSFSQTWSWKIIRMRALHAGVSI